MHLKMLAGWELQHLNLFNDSKSHKQDCNDGYISDFYPLLSTLTCWLVCPSLSNFYAAHLKANSRVLLGYICYFCNLIYWHMDGMIIRSTKNWFINLVL